MGWDFQKETAQAIADAEQLADLAPVFGTDAIHDLYVSAKAQWEKAVARKQRDVPKQRGLPGTCVTVDGHDFHVHGVTHADTDAEREFCRRHVSEFLNRGAVIYCEQGIRSMYFEDIDAICEMDDYLWATHQCKQLDGDSRLDLIPEERVDAIVEDITTVASMFREAAFSLIDAGRPVYGAEFERAIGDIAAGFLTSHADIAVGKSYESFQLSQSAAKNPQRLHELQQYYERAFLPQPLEREWLRRHDPELELVSHARNERMADYAVYHNQNATEVHLIVGAAHQPGVVYYLEQYSQGKREPTEFELY